MKLNNTPANTLTDEKEISGLEIQEFNKGLLAIAYKHEQKEKEQKLLYASLELFNTGRNISHVIQTLVDQITDPAIGYTGSCMRVVFDGKAFCSKNFLRSEHGLCFQFDTFSGKPGIVEFYTDITASFTGPVLDMNDATDFLKALVNMLKNWINNKETESKFQNMFVQLEAKVESKTEELKLANQKLLERNKDVNDSINCANKIQRAILPEADLIDGTFEEACVFYKPKDVVSGDFYWFHNDGEKILYACADCTGHGVPGALMSMVGNQLLNHLVIDQKKSDPAIILREMDRAVMKLFSKSNVAFHLRDGMAISLCVIDQDKKTLSFAGAFNNAYVFRDNEMIVLEADRNSIGGCSDNEGHNFTRTEISYESGDKLYMFTDGLPDQFGGSKGKKLMRKKLLEKLTQIKDQTMASQKIAIETMFNEWMGGHFQVDDVTLLGAKL